ncbi:uncharacterized protein LY79DRAFT_395676 [Colletotrichum navitas]|uniref:Uncharacterized protein n=1 Tax=Colletotrichum navitas TaxID=681940 RepID=A0AAD8PQ93_9PEZI|nr:uncharacterized protein LY79DRAFT_395676 [Colletotrichum navitas]KAK1573936.1 hypothetical protein LY79DRAFT_395676 [Colletotrichum navitas]
MFVRTVPRYPTCLGRAILGRGEKGKRWGNLSRLLLAKTEERLNLPQPGRCQVPPCASGGKRCCHCEKKDERGKVQSTLSVLPFCLSAFPHLPRTLVSSTWLSPPPPHEAKYSRLYVQSRQLPPIVLGHINSPLPVSVCSACFPVLVSPLPN